MAKGSGGTGSGKGGGTSKKVSRGAELRAKFGSAEIYLEDKFRDRFYPGFNKPTPLVENLAKNTRQRRDVKEGEKYKNPKAVKSSIARNERKRNKKR